MTMHFFLRCQFYHVIWGNLMNDLMNIDSSRPTENDEKSLENDEKSLDILLYGNRNKN